MVVEQLRTLVELFADVALTDPFSAVLLALGALLVGFSAGLFGYLTLRGVGAWLGGTPTAGTPRQAQ